MYQFCYASESTSSKADLLQDLTDILKEARDFNHPNQITGCFILLMDIFPVPGRGMSSFKSFTDRETV